MSIELENINNSTDSNGKKGASFPAIVTDSGSSLPATSGYQEGDTFLNTSDKKLYTTTATYSSSISNYGLDVTTGEITGFSSSKYLEKTNNFGGVPLDNITIHFKTGNDITTEQCLLCAYGLYAGTHYKYSSFIIKNGKLYCINQGDSSETQLISLDVNSEYKIIGKLAFDYGGHTNFTNCSIYKENNVVYTGSFAFAFPNSPSMSVHLYFGVLRNQYDYLNPFLGTMYWDTNWNGNILVANLSWDSGVALTDKTEYADKTNGILYLYENEVLNAIPNLEDYRKKAETITISTASVTIANVQANKNYVLSSSALTDITLTACETSFEETSIEFTLPADISNFSFTDNSGITWVDGSPTFNASKSYLIVIFNKLGFVKEY